MSVSGKLHSAGLAGWLLLACVGLSACDRNDPPKTEAPKLTTDTLPKEARALDVDFDGKLKLVGYRINTKGPMRPGRRVSVSLYWRADKKLEAGYRLASRLVDASGEELANLDDASPLRAQKDGRALHGPESWTPGTLYIDELGFNVPGSAKTTKVQLLASLAKAEQRIKVTAGPSADSTSAVVLTAPTGFHPRTPPSPPPTLRVDKLDASVKIRLDGKLDEPAWQSVTSQPFVDTATGKPNPRFPLGGTFRLLWGKEGFYVGAELTDPNIVGGFKADQKDPHVWTKDALMLMVDPDGDGDNVDYYEIQISPQNLVYDTHYDTLNEPHKDPDGPFGHEEWSSNVKSAVTLQGTIDKTDDQDHGYVVEALIPWKAFEKAKRTPPAVGDVWRINVYAMRDGRGVGWSPLLGKGTLHKASRFGRVLWAEKGYVEPAPSAAPSAAPPSPSDAKAEAPSDAKAEAAEEKKPGDSDDSDANRGEEAPADVAHGRAAVPLGAKK